MLDAKLSTVELDKILSEDSANALVSNQKSLKEIFSKIQKQNERITEYIIEYPEALIIILKLIKTVNSSQLTSLFFEHLEEILQIRIENFAILLSTEGIHLSLLKCLKTTKQGGMNKNENSTANNTQFSLNKTIKILSMLIYYALNNISDLTTLQIMLNQQLKAYLSFASSLEKSHEAAKSLLWLWYEILKNVQLDLVKQGHIMSKITTIMQNLAPIIDISLKFLAIASMRSDMPNRTLNNGAISPKSTEQPSELHPILSSPHSSPEKASGLGKRSSLYIYPDQTPSEIFRDITTINLNIISYIVGQLNETLKLGIK